MLLHYKLWIITMICEYSLIADMQRNFYATPWKIKFTISVLMENEVSLINANFNSSIAKKDLKI